MARMNRSGSFEIVGATDSESYHGNLDQTGSTKFDLNKAFQTGAGIFSSWLQPSGGGGNGGTTKLPAWVLPVAVGGVGILVITMVATKKK